MTGLYCLKCGSEVRAPDVFCKKCLAKMAAFPVRSDAVIQLPVRPASVAEKPSRKKNKSYADYVRTLRRLIRALCVIVAVLTLIICLLCSLLYHQIKSDEAAPDIGKNYTSTEQETT